MTIRRHVSGAEESIGTTRAQRRAEARAARANPGPEAAAAILCDMAEDLTALAGRVEEALKSGDKVQQQLADGMEKLQEAIERGDRNTAALAGVIGDLTEELKRLREGG